MTEPVRNVKAKTNDWLAYRAKTLRDAIFVSQNQEGERYRAGERNRTSWQAELDGIEAEQKVRTVRRSVVTPCEDCSDWTVCAVYGRKCNA